MRPFPYGDEARNGWRSYWESEAKGPRPEPPYSTWIERLDDLRGSGYDLSARNPHQDDRQTLPHPAEITARLLERTREFQSILEHVHNLVSNGEETE